MNGIAFYRSGLALTVSQSGTMQSTGHRQQPAQPGLGQTGAAADPTIDQWFDPAAFSRTEPTGTFGHIGATRCAVPRSSTSTCLS